MTMVCPAKQIQALAVNVDAETWQTIAEINSRELRDKVIADLLCNHNYCMQVRANAVASRCDALLADHR